MYHNRSFFWSFEIDGKSVEAMPRTRIEVNTAANCVAAARNGAGIARLFDYQVPEEVSSGALVHILKDYGSEPRPIHIVYSRQGLLALKVRAFIDWVLPRLRAACSNYGDAPSPE